MIVVANVMEVTIGQPVVMPGGEKAGVADELHFNVVKGVVVGRATFPIVHALPHPELGEIIGGVPTRGRPIPRHVLEGDKALAIREEDKQGVHPWPEHNATPAGSGIPPDHRAAPLARARGGIEGIGVVRVRASANGHRVTGRHAVVDRKAGTGTGGAGGATTPVVIA